MEINNILPSYDTGFIIYGRVKCRECLRVKTLLETNKKVYKYIDYDKHKYKVKLLKNVENKKTLPFIFFNNKHIYNINELRKFM